MKEKYLPRIILKESLSPPRISGNLSQFVIRGGLIQGLFAYTVFCPINRHSKRWTPLISGLDFMKLYKDYTNKPFSFLVNDATLPSDNPLIFRKTVNEKIKNQNN